MSRLPRQNNKAELDAFELVCLRLHGFAPHVHFEFVDGYLTGLATLPTWPPPDDWLAHMSNDAFERVFADPEDHAWALRALTVRLNVLRDQLDAEALSEEPGFLRLNPVLTEPMPAEGDLPATELGTTWAMGCLIGLDFVEGHLDLPTDGPLLDEYEKLRDVLDTMAEPGDPADTARRERLLTEAMFAMQVMRLWALDTLPAITTRRVEQTPGRNDPCPCGSGKKFKKCHGA